jgi:hypothetical protein
MPLPNNGGASPNTGWPSWAACIWRSIDKSQKFSGKKEVKNYGENQFRRKGLVSV